ncbi:GIP [Symbiodinium sp. CCMP2456]|nr:GIP [Symbiodinium sp. CCMP2456]
MAGEAVHEQAVAVRGDEEPALTEPNNSETSDRPGSAGDEWTWSDHSQGASRWDPSWASWGWNHAWRGHDQAGRNTDDLEHRGSRTTSWGNYSTDASSYYARPWNGHEGNDGGFDGGDFGRGDHDFRAGLGDSEGVWRDPWADGRARIHGWHDSPDGAYGGEWAAHDRAQESVWSGWKHFPNGKGLQPSNANDRGGTWKGGAPRPSEKLSVPVFTGEDDDDVGTSARSYLRQVEAWRRLTFLPNNQQGLVLYRHLAGKAWVAAEELNVDALSREDGVHYLMSWLRNRYLDLEVTRIGKALSEMFRKLRRKQGQSIRDYNAEYDRLHARLKEVGCMLPEECSAWLYVDRLQLEESAELNLLASVGNVYSLGKLQKAAIIQDRGLRKPWESGKGGRRPYTAHITDADNDEDPLPEDDEEDEGYPEELAVAYMTFQNAKAKYREQARSRGYKGDGNKDGGKDNGKGDGPRGDLKDKTREDKLKQIKARSFCSGCGRRGHWHLDDECPNNANKGGGHARTAPTREVCVMMPAQVMTLRHEAGVLMGITDTACARTVAGTQWLQDYMDKLGDHDTKPQLSKECEAYKFGTGRIHYSSFNVILSFALGNSVVQLRTSIIPGDIPLLLSKTVLGKLGMIYDVTEGRADFNAVGLKDYDLMVTPSGLLSTRGPFPRLRRPVSLMATPECAKELPISKMTKPQLIQECLRLGLTVHRTWSPEEIKAVIVEHREKYKQGDATERMKRMSHLSMPELKMKAQELGVEFPANVTKGNLLRLVRDTLNTPDNELMKIGKYRGMEFREVPWQYGRWASNEIKGSNADPELVLYARWWERKEEEKRQQGYSATPEETQSHVPGASSEATSWANVDAWEESWPRRATTAQSNDQMPIAPNAKASTKRRTQKDGEESMDDEPDAEALEEIRKLETRLAILKSKTKAKGRGH